jgi:hypothetical protein
MLQREWNTYSPVKQRWMIYRLIKNFPDGISRPNIKERAQIDYGATLGKRSLDKMLHHLTRQEAIRWSFRDGAVLWEITGNVEAYSKTASPVSGVRRLAAHTMGQ